VLLRSLAPRGEAEDVLGDIQEAHALRMQRRGLFTARVLRTIETLEMAAALLLVRLGRIRTIDRSRSSVRTAPSSGT
jgi:hypothetical protein